jgi:hypothetical protein
MLKHPVAALEHLALRGAMILGVPDGRLPDLVLRDVPDFQGGSVRSRLTWLRRLGWPGGLLTLGMVVSTGGFLALPVLALALASHMAPSNGGPLSHRRVLLASIQHLWNLAVLLLSR